MKNQIQGIGSTLSINEQGKDNPTNPKNQIFEAYKAKTKTITESKAKALFKNKDFGSEYRGVYLASSILNTIFSLVSACTVFTALYWGLTPMLGTLLSTTFGLIICVLLEGIKSGIWNKLGKNILKYKQAPFLLVVSAIALNFSSIGGSIMGAYQLPQIILSQQIGASNESIESKAIEVDTTIKHLNNRLSYLDNLIKTQTNEITKTTSNSTKRSFSKNIALQEDAKAKIATQILAHRKDAKQANKERKQAKEKQDTKDLKSKNKELERMQSISISLAIFFEFMLIICLSFNTYYLFRIDIDISINSTPLGSQILQINTNEANELPSGYINKNTTNKIRNSLIVSNGTENVPTRTENVPTKKRNTIGFRTESVPTRTESVLNGTENVPIEFTRICSHTPCSRKYLHGHGNQKYCSKKCRMNHHKGK
jgi:hypothetical protein